MSDGDDFGLLYRNAILKSLYNLVLESHEDKKAQKIMWELLDVGVKRVRECVSKPDLNSTEENIENNFS